MSREPLAFLETRAVPPLGCQFDMLKRKSAPDALLEIFDDGSNTSVYAILDGSRITNIEECLEASGLPHACLFQDNVSYEMRAIAPWLVMLEDRNAFTRSLFTRGDATWCRWDANAGIIIRAHAEFDIVRRHFRRFTRIRDERGQWYYFRFWEPSLWPYYFDILKEDAERIAHWALYRNRQVVFEIIAIDGSLDVIRRLIMPTPPHPTNSSFTLDAREMQAFKLYRHQRFSTRLIRHLSSQSPAFAALSADAQLRQAEVLHHQAIHYGLSIEKAVADFATAYVLSDGAMVHVGLCRMILESDDHQIDKGRKLLIEVRTRRKVVDAG